MQKQELPIENYELVKVEKRYGDFKTEDGRVLPFANYYIHFKHVDNPLIMTARVEKVFRDYVEQDDQE